MQPREEFVLDFPDPGDRRGHQLGVVRALPVRSRRRRWRRPDGDFQPGGLQPRGAGGPRPRHHQFDAPYRNPGDRGCTGDNPPLIREPSVVEPHPDRCSSAIRIDWGVLKGVGPPSLPRFLFRGIPHQGERPTGDPSSSTRAAGFPRGRSSSFRRSTRSRNQLLNFRNHYT